MIINDYENTNYAIEISTMYQKAYRTLKNKHKFNKEFLDVLKDKASFDDVIKLLNYKNNL